MLGICLLIFLCDQMNAFFSFFIKGKHSIAQDQETTGD